MRRAALILNPNQLLFLSGLALSLSVVFFACESDKPIRIGFIAATSGHMADIGISARNAVLLAVEQCNDQGGIGGRRVTLIIKDDQEKAESAVPAVQALIKEGVAAIVGPMSSTIAKAIIPYLNESKVVAVGGTVTTEQLSGLDDYFFRDCITTREQASRSAHYQIDSGDMRRIAVAYDGGNRSFSENWLENFRSPFVDGGGNILISIEFTKEGNRSFSDIAREMLAAGPDGILIIANPMDSALMCQQIRKANTTIKITLSQWAATQRLIELGGKAVEGVTLPVAFDWDSPNPRYQEFRKFYAERYKREPGYPGYYAYDAAKVVLTALNARKKGQSIKESILAIGEFDGLQGKIRFDAYGDVKASTASMRLVRNRKFVVVE